MASDNVSQETSVFKEIINDLLDLDRMEDGTTHVERTECDVAGLTRRLAEDWRQRAASGGRDLAVEVTSAAVVLEADPVLCQQLLGHLVDNALKFTPEGGRILVRLSEQGTAVRLVVEDSGIGIPEEKLHTIFEQFYQVDGSSTREVGGQGVGLSICQDIVSWHDGRIWAENVPTGGARFTVLLPRRPHVVMPEPPAAINPVFHEPRLFLQRMIHWVGENLGVRTAILLKADSAGDHLSALAATGLPAASVATAEWTQTWASPSAGGAKPLKAYGPEPVTVVAALPLTVSMSPVRPKTGSEKRTLTESSVRSAVPEVGASGRTVGGVVSTVMPSLDGEKAPVLPARSVAKARQ